ncbi:hypothetical protein EDB85DRAFT_2146334 [Lactarius pseudohatsudake]|nr:hypothetical protein EDB85DRAFT_2146334 [Lactarius pseudohatsudake]
MDVAPLVALQGGSSPNAHPLSQEASFKLTFVSRSQVSPPWSPLRLLPFPNLLPPVTIRTAPDATPPCRGKDNELRQAPSLPQVVWASHHDDASAVRGPDHDGPDSTTYTPTPTPTRTTAPPPPGYLADAT